MLETCDNGNFWWSQASFCPSRPGNELGEKIFLGYSDCLIFAHPSLGISINRNCSQIIMHPRRSRSLSDTAIRQSVCPSPRRTAALGYRRAGCLQLSHVRTADPSADGQIRRESNCHQRGGQSSRRPRGDNLLVLRPWHVRSVNCPFASCCFMFTNRVSGKSIAIGRVRSFHFILI